MEIGLLIIGDEILSGKRVDRHFQKLVELLSARGLRLAWTEIIGDDPLRITATLRRTFTANDIVFSCGGIGATPDDYTRRCAAEALGVPLVLHREAKLLIQQRIADMAQSAGETADLSSPENLHRLKMGEFPEGAEIIPNAFNGIPGFTVRRSANAAHHFMPGFPVMAAPMMEWILETHYAPLFHRDTHAEQSLLVFGAMESALTPLMEEIEAIHEGIKVFSLPHVGDETIRRHIELGVKGEADRVSPAFEMLRDRIESMGHEFRPV
jgi:molybdopterin-biosynthesis enzyme MoeA-like protein